jgi:hypothetical protein
MMISQKIGVAQRMSVFSAAAQRRFQGLAAFEGNAVRFPLLQNCLFSARVLERRKTKKATGTRKTQKPPTVVRGA